MWHIPLYNSDFTIAHSDAMQGLEVRPNFQTLFYPATVGG
jgi:peptide/nickel transport system substrate-binding protein